MALYVVLTKKNAKKPYGLMPAKKGATRLQIRKALQRNRRLTSKFNTRIVTQEQALRSALKLIR